MDEGSWIFYIQCTLTQEEKKQSLYLVLKFNFYLKELGRQESNSGPLVHRYSNAMLKLYDLGGEGRKVTLKTHQYQIDLVCNDIGLK